MATYLAHDALRLPAASLLANSGLCVNIEIEIWLLLGVNVATALRKYCLCNRVVNTWNSLPNYVVSANTTKMYLKNRLDKFWHDQEIIYDFNAQLEGTGS